MAEGSTTEQAARPWWQRLVLRIAMSAPGAWLFARTAHHLDWLCWRLSGKRLSLTYLMTGITEVWLTTTGAKSGQPRTVPLLAIQDGERFILIASNWGQSHHPAWYYNVRAQPTVTLTVRGYTAAYLAREATASERATYWPRAIVLYPGYALYRQRASQRTIPMFVLTPWAE